jgi:hypothetical protein
MISTVYAISLLSILLLAEARHLHSDAAGTCPCRDPQLCKPIIKQHAKEVNK